MIRQTATDGAAAVESINPRTQKIIGRWLLGCAGMCFGAICIGGITRYPSRAAILCLWAKHSEK